MTGCIATLLLFPLVGVAVSRLVGRVQPFLAGAGAVGTLLFIAGVAHVPLRLAIGIIIAGSILILIVRRGKPAARIAYPPLPTAIAAVVSVWLLFMTAIVPLNDYDGRAFWLLKAKAIAHERQIDGPFFQQRASFSPRNQYPLLVPLDAAVAMMAGRELDDRQTRWLYACFGIAFALEIRRRIGALVSAETGAWLAAAFLALPQIISASTGAASAGCDVPLGAFAAAAFFELVDGRSPLRLGMWLSFVTLTKSEGLPLAILLLLVAAFVLRKQAVAAAVPPAIAAAALLLWRTRVPRSDETPSPR
jgi:hypothetical protein